MAARIFVTGGTGFVGSAVVGALLDAGHAVTGLVRSDESAAALTDLGATPVRGSLMHPAGVAAIATEYDATIHMGFERSMQGVAVDRAVVRAVIKSVGAATSPRHFIYTSGLWVLGETGDGPVDEGGSTDEPVALVGWRPAHERIVLDAAGGTLTTSVIRPGMVYGGSGGLLASFFESAAAGEPLTHIGDGQNHACFIHREDNAQLYAQVIDQRAQGIFHGIDDSPRTVADVASAVAKAAGAGSRAESVAVEVARAEGGLFADAMCTNQVAVARRSRELGWRPTRPPVTESAREAFAEWEDAQG